jgi:hypothetical protein
VVVLPSFRSEWALRLHGAERFGYAISVSQVDKPLWENKSADVSQSEHRLDVTRDFADALTGVVTRALLTVSNTNRPRIGVDGVTYHFLAQHPEFHRICGQTWSPAPSTMAGKLVDLIERLRRRVQGDSSPECSIDTIESELQRFEIPPPYRPNHEQIEAVARDTNRSVELYTKGVISAEELISNLSHAWENHGFPNPGDVIRLLAKIPSEIQTRLRK